MKPGISVCFVIKNGVKQGYPFWESLLSCLPIADEIVISEGGSEDGTAAYISKFAMKYGSDKLPVRIFRDDWNSKSSQHGEVISWVSEKNMRRCTREWVYYLQADEIIHEGNADFIKSVASGAAGRFNAVEFYFWHFINSWDPVKSGAAYHKAIRMVKNRPDIKLMGDAWTFHGAVQPVCKYAAVPHPLFHLGWVFPENCDVKNVEHGKIYQGMNNYQRAASASKERLANGGYEKGYSLPSDTASFPKLIARLYGKVRYELPDEALS